MTSPGLPFLPLFALPSTVWFILRKMTLRALAKKEQVFAPGKVLIKIYSDWTSLGLASLFDQSHLVGSCCALIGWAWTTCQLERGGEVPCPNHMHQGGGVGPQIETEGLAGIWGYGCQAA